MSALALAGALIASVSPPATAAAKPRAQVISFGRTTCAPHWYAPNHGEARFRIKNKSSRRANIYLLNAVTSAVVAKVIDLRGGRDTELTAHVKLAHTYLWSCDVHGRPIRLSDPEKVPRDPSTGGPGKHVQPVTAGEVAPLLRAYRHLTATLIARLRRKVGALVVATHGTDRGKAEQAWLAAHLAWLRIGQDDGAYGAFGVLGGDVDGLADGLRNGVHSRSFTGFHKVEYDLWTRHDLPAARLDSDVLRGLVQRLARLSLHTALPSDRTGAANWILRAHEIIEDAFRDSLSANDDYGSGTDAASVRTDIVATRTMLRLLAPLLAPRAPHLVTHARRQLDRATQAVLATRHDSAWVAITAMPRRARERLDARVGQVDETLAPIPDPLRVGGT